MLLKEPNEQLLDVVDHNQLRTMASESVDSIDHLAVKTIGSEN